MAEQLPLPGNQPCSLVELSVSCRNLLDMDVFSKSDPICVLFTKSFASDRWEEFGRTEIIWDNLNPDFVKKFLVSYFFEESQKLKFELYDVDSTSPDLSKHDFLGRMECTLGEIVTSASLKRALLGPKKDCGCIIVRCEELGNCKEEVSLQFCARNLDKKDFFGKSDPFLLLYKSTEDGQYTVVHRTEYHKRTLNPTWQPFTISVRSLCNGDYDRSIKVECYDWDRDGGHDLIGHFYVTLRQLNQGPGENNVHECFHPKKAQRTSSFSFAQCVNPKKSARSKKYRHSGTVHLMSCQIVQVDSFLDYIKGGTQMECTIAIDFTASNGNPSDPASLHYINRYQPSLYARALKAVGEIIQDYDSDKLFPAFGFGAKMQDGKVYHDFYLNGHPANPYCNGIDGVLQAYHSTLQRVQLYGPTNFAPIINNVARLAAERRDGSDYFILLILTDGIISDMPQTCEAIVNASKLPLSIIIVGIGDADFEAMEILDGDEVRLSSRGREAERDIVQFVPFRNFIASGGPADMNRSQARLAREVLYEIPDQFVSYMKKNNIKPKPPVDPPSYSPSAPPSYRPGATAFGT